MSQKTWTWLQALVIGLILGSLAIAIRRPVHAEEKAQEQKMQMQEFYPVFITDKLLECRDFYVKHLGFEVVFESTIFIQLSAAAPSGGKYYIAFLPPKNPFQPPIFTQSFSGVSATLALQVADVKTVYEQLQKAGVTIEYKLTDEPWGQRHFFFRDPAGILIDVVQPIEAAPGYYDDYQLPKTKE